MLHTYTEEEMLSLFKLRAGLLTTDCGCTISRQDGIDIDKMLIADIRRWYASLLLTAPEALLPIENLASSAITEWDEQESIATITLPPRGVRLLGVRLKTMQREITTFCAPGSYEDRLYSSHEVRTYASYPVAILSGRTLIILGCKSGELQTLRMITAPDDNTYTLHPSLLPQITTPTDT